MTTKEYDVSIEKHVDGLDGLNVVLVADLHLGYSIGCKDMEKMVKRINALNPDVVIYAGDIFDNDYDALDDPDRLSQIIHMMRGEKYEPKMNQFLLKIIHYVTMVNITIAKVI